MKYQVWTKGDEYSGWSKKDCPDLKTALAEVLANIKTGKEPLVTQEVPFEVDIKLKEVPIEAKESETKPDQDPAGKSHGKVRRGDAPAPERLDKGSGDNLAGPGAGDRA